MIPKIAAVIPAYNEVTTIREIARAALPHVTEVIVVDDGSSDGTAAALAGLNVVVLRNHTNEGKAASLWRGMQHALMRGAAAVVTLDGDGQHRPEDIPRLLAAAAQWPHRIIVGARVHDAQAAPRLRRAANRFADFWISWAAGHWIADSQSGYRVYPAQFLSVVNAHHDRAHGFVFESESLIEAARLGYETAMVPIAAIYKTNGRPSHFRPVMDIAMIVRTVAWKLVSRGFYLSGLYRALRDRAGRNEAYLRAKRSTSV